MLDPGDKAARGTPGIGEAICPECHGEGRAYGTLCPHCRGRCSITRAIGGA